MHYNISPGNRRFLRNSSSIFTLLLSQFKLLNYGAKCCREQPMWDDAPLSYSPLDPNFLTPRCVDVLLLSCSEGLMMYFSISIMLYTSYIPCPWNGVSITWECTESNAFW